MIAHSIHGYFLLELRFVESMSARQQIGVAALLFAIALGLVAMSQPMALTDGTTQPTVDLAVYP